MMLLDPTIRKIKFLFELILLSLFLFLLFRRCEFITISKTFLPMGQTRW